MEPMGEQTLRVEAGVPCAKVARYAARLGLGGAEFLAGIPGTMGGTLAMNAGAFGGETWARVEQVETLDRSGRHRRRGRGEYRVGYREVRGPAGEWFIAATLGLASRRRDSAGLSRASRLASTQPACTLNCVIGFRR